MFLSAWLADASSLIAALIISYWLVRRGTALERLLALFRNGANGRLLSASGYRSRLPSCAWLCSPGFRSPIRSSMMNSATCWSPTPCCPGGSPIRLTRFGSTLKPSMSSAADLQLDLSPGSRCASRCGSDPLRAPLVCSCRNDGCHERRRFLVIAPAVWPALVRCWNICGLQSTWDHELLDEQLLGRRVWRPTAGALVFGGIFRFLRSPAWRWAALQVLDWQFSGIFARTKLRG